MRERERERSEDEEKSERRSRFFQTSMLLTLFGMNRRWINQTRISLFNDCCIHFLLLFQVDLFSSRAIKESFNRHSKKSNGRETTTTSSSSSGADRGKY